MDIVRYEVPGWGVGEVAVRAGRLLYHELPRPRHSEHEPNYPQGIPEIPVVSLANTSSRLRAGMATKIARRLAEYFAGTREAFDDLQLDLSGYTPFQRALTDALRA